MWGPGWDGESMIMRDSNACTNGRHGLLEVGLAL
jgi:hypothetical protein